jgi:glycosyltransferase involved in cell wall biosynthesis
MNTVLSFIDWYLPGSRGGGALKAFANQVAHLNEAYRFKVITRDTDYTEATPYDSVSSDQWNEAGANTNVFYASAKRINYSSLKKLVRQTDFDVVYIHGIYSFWFSILPIFLVKRKGDFRIIVAAHGMLGDHALAVKSVKKKLFLVAAKALGLYKNIAFHAANQSEADDVRKAIGPKADVIVAQEMPMKVKLKEWHPRKKANGELKLVSIARISPEKNTLYALQSLKETTTGKISFDIYGPVYTGEYWNQCLSVIADLPQNVTVNYHGSLPGEQVLEVLSNYHFLFLPSTGENFGHVILESFMAFTPVIISDTTPWRGLEKSGVGWDLPLQDMPAFSSQITLAANLDQQSYDELSRKTRAYAQNLMDDDTVKKQNERLFDNSPSG